jgi:16S rRNA C967 or C1407 C5-methylase (RsmB/RsmF family)/NOL1/NOP2/fmu family ribosome biogenesis protein
MTSSTTLPPPDDFLRKMQALLSPEMYGRFLAAYDQPPHTGLRVNTLKVTAADFTSMSLFPLTPAGEFEPAAFMTTADERPGRHPYHDAGLYYLQEPSAMVAAALLDPQPGELVLDIAAAPGGKATHLLSLLNRDAVAGRGSVLRHTLDSPGLLVANDIVRNRAAILAGNLARWGAANTLTTAAEPARLAEQFGPVFDRVLVDAPCSGEGMFRRQGGFEWSERMVLACAQRQSSLLMTAAELVRPGGRLLYATCTFSPEENEQTIAHFLNDHAEYRLLDPPRFAGFGRGRPEWAGNAKRPELARAVRLWPQEFPGEGHFLALLQRESTTAETPGPELRPFPIRPPSPPELAHWRAFVEETLALDIPSDRLHAAGGRLYLLPARRPDTGGLHLVRYGLLLGELRPGYFRPGHELALALDDAGTQRNINWTPDDGRLAAYVAGEDMADPGPNGWLLVTVDGFGLGWSKRVDGRLKNHYPRPLRRRLGSEPG